MFLAQSVQLIIPSGAKSSQSEKRPFSKSAQSLAQSNIPGGFQPASLKRRPAASEIAFATADVSAAYERALVAGALTVAAPMAKP